MYELAEVRDQDTIPRLMKNLGEEDVVYRRASVKALGCIGADSVPALVECLGSSDNPTVKASCAKALTQVAVKHPDTPFPDLGIQALKSALDDLNPVVHISSVMALGEIGGPALDILLDTLETTDNLGLGVAIINALGSIGGEKAEAKLKALSEDDSADRYLKESAVSVLSRMDLVKTYSRKPASE